MSRAISITREDHDAASLRRSAAESRDANAARRMLAIAMVLEGASRRDAARLAGMDRQTLVDWVHRYNADGLEGLSDRKPPGREARLTPDQMARVAEWLETGPDPDVDGVIRWRRIDLARKIGREFGVTLAERSMTEVLRRLGYRRLSVRPQHPAQDAEAVEAHKITSLTWSRPPSRRRPAASQWNSGGRMKPGSASKAP